MQIDEVVQGRDPAEANEEALGDAPIEWLSCVERDGM